MIIGKPGEAEFLFEKLLFESKYSSLKSYLHGSKLILNTQDIHKTASSQNFENLYRYVTLFLNVNSYDTILTQI